MSGSAKTLALLSLLVIAACVPSVEEPDGTGGAAGPGTGGSGAGGARGTGGAGMGGASAGTGGATVAGTGGAAAGTGGRVGTGGRGGATGSGGTIVTGSGGARGSGGAPGAGGMTAGGTGGTTSVTCTITPTSMVSTNIATVGIVTFTTDLPNITSAEIQFSPADGTGTMMVAPVDLTQPMYRTLLLGMKGSRAYSYRIVARSAAGSCTSQPAMITTGAVPTSVTKPTVTIMNAAAHQRGFIVTSSGAMGNTAYILDGDGDIVWWSTMAPASPSRARMSWDGKQMYMLSLNVQNTGGSVTRVMMDGSNREANLSGLTTSHHDFTPIPDGIATMLWNTTGIDAHCSVIERSSSGTMTTVVADLSTIYNSTTFHSNAIHYYPSDDTYTISDRNPNLFVKITRKGQLIWQFGGTNPKDQTKFFQPSGGTWQVNHGHQLLPNGNFLFFNNGAMAGGTSMAREYKLDTTNMMASSVWTYQASGVNSAVLSDVVRLPNGNTLVTFSLSGTMHEVDATGKLVMTIKASGFGYTEFRESLYGQPR